MAIQIPDFEDPKEKVAWLRAKMIELSTDHDNPAIEAESSRGYRCFCYRSSCTSS